MVPEVVEWSTRRLGQCDSEYLHRHLNDEPIAILDIDDAVSLQVDHRD
jgi:hypothetical protein